MNANVAELSIRDCATISAASAINGVYYVITVTDALVERSRFERNGILGDTSGAGGGYVSPPPGGSIASTVAYVSTAWIDNEAGSESTSLYPQMLCLSLTEMSPCRGSCRLHPPWKLRGALSPMHISVRPLPLDALLVAQCAHSSNRSRHIVGATSHTKKAAQSRFLRWRRRRCVSKTACSTQTP